VSAIVPGIFSADSTGSGAPAGLWVLTSAGGTQTSGALFNPKNLAPVPINLGQPTDQVFLSLYGTGFRGYSGHATATVGGMNVPVTYAAADGIYLGEDDVNIGPLPRALAGSGTVNVVLSFDGVSTNTVTVAFR
jgi:uncharacterized protein (TIGR03437 family)